MTHFPSLSQALHAIKGRAGYLINLKTEPWFGRHISLQRTFPYLLFRKIVPERFLSVRIDITNKCNLRCKMCYFSMEKVKQQPRTEMPVQLFRKIARQVFPVARQLIISAGAEPLYAKDFPKMLEIVADYDIPHTAFFTNGTLLNEQNITTIIASGISLITISFDGATAHTYEAIRRGAKFDRVINNIRLLQHIKRQMASSTPALHFGVVLMQTNIAELPDLLRLAKDLGIERVTASHLVPYSELGTKTESLRETPDLANTYLDNARQVAQEIGIAFDAPPNFTQEPPQPIPPESHQSPPTCHWPWDEILIRPDGSVNPCCYWYENMSMGNFSTQSFKQIWHGNAYQTLRHELTTHSLREMCRRCPEMSSQSREVEVVK
ncbi:radical SAM protein [candidate division KSB3 bacterium]|uniref:Radical SAM protein n=1 Tax=candidate division KSB3 bacterium TaxID=2044937 RepID=A0A9D5K012_9BACT|nr:radical SAM protein [candidate division KSB3 bacterium]MBD3327368.1 radical SAM protein [candidate division KSB3 bacterium]